MPAPRKYPEELLERAVREVRATGRPIAHVAKDLGIHMEVLRGWVWVRQTGADHGERDDRLTTAEHGERKQHPSGNAEVKRASADETEQVVDHLHANSLGVDPVCRVLNPSPSAYFARKNPPVAFTLDVHSRRSSDGRSPTACGPNYP
jgi:transposase